VKGPYLISNMVEGRRVFEKGREPGRQKEGLGSREGSYSHNDQAAHKHHVLIPNNRLSRGKKGVNRAKVRKEEPLQGQGGHPRLISSNEERYSIVPRGGSAASKITQVEGTASCPSDACSLKHRAQRVQDRSYET